jgi:sugar phosphate isomerase/epimerase
MLIDHRQSLEHRIGLGVPRGWWPSAATLKGIEAAGFRWTQVFAPGVEMLANPRHCVRHSTALRRALETTELSCVLHAPPGLRLGSAMHDRAFEGLLEYAHQIGSRHVVYHALDFPRRGEGAAAEERSLRRLAEVAEALRTSILVENLCPRQPGPANVCHDPLALRHLVHRIGSPACAMLFDLGHANVVAGIMRVELMALLEPVLGRIGAFHVHDNFAARRNGEGGAAHDPLRLDLHLAPGSGSLPWESVRPVLLAHPAPLVLEVHPAHRPQVATLHDIAVSVIGGRDVRASGTLAQEMTPDAVSASTRVPSTSR